MADFSKEDLKQAFREALQESGRNFNPGSIDKLLDNLTKLDKQIKESTPTTGSFFKSMLTGKRAIQDLSSELKSLENKIEELSESADESAIAQRQELIQRKVAIQRLNEQNIAQKVAIDGITSFGKAISGVAGVAGRTMGGLVRGIQDGSSAFSLAGGIMTGAIDGMNTGVQAAAGGMGAIGTTMMMSTNPRLKMLGVAATVAGTALGAFGNIMAGTGKAVVELMVKEMEKAVKSYQSLSSSGAVFSNGMTGMYQAALNANLTINQFSEVVSKSSAVLASSGLGVGQAIIMMGRVGKAMREARIDTELLKLGYSFQEQAELSAEVMSDMRTANSSLLKDPAGIAKATADYATNLRVIAAITGEDAKKKMEETRRASANVAFRLKMQELEEKHPGIYRKTLDAMSTMTPQMQQNIREHIVFGQAVSETGAVMEATSGSFRDAVGQTVQSINNGTLDVEKNQQAQGEYYNKLRTESDKAIFGMAGMTGQLTDLSKAWENEWLASDSRTKEGIEAAQKAAKEQKSATDELTKGYVTAARGAQDLAISLQEKTLPLLEKFATFSGLIIAELAKQLAALKGLDGTDEPSFWEELKGNLMPYVSGGATIGAGIGAAGGGVGAIPGAAIGAGAGVVGAVTQTAVDRWRRPTSYTPNKTGPDNADKYSGLNIGGRWKGEAIEGGPADDEVIKLAKKVQALYPNATFNAFNDTFHKGGAHAAGKAVDFSLGFKPTDEQGKKIVAQIKELGFRNVIDEYNHPSEGATGGHIHAALAKGGITHGPSLAGEAGPEAVIPLPDGRTIPVKMDGIGELIEKFDEMIRILKDQLDVSEKHLRADT